MASVFPPARAGLAWICLYGLYREKNSSGGKNIWPPAGPEPIQPAEKLNQPGLQLFFLPGEKTDSYFIHSFHELDFHIGGQHIAHHDVECLQQSDVRPERDPWACQRDGRGHDAARGGLRVQEKLGKQLEGRSKFLWTPISNYSLSIHEVGN